MGFCFRLAICLEGRVGVLVSGMRSGPPELSIVGCQSFKINPS